MGRNRFDFQFCRIVIHGAESRSDGRHRTAVPTSKQSKSDVSTPSSTARRDRSSWNTPAATGTGPLAIVASLRGEETLFGPNRLEERPIFRPVAPPLAWCRTGPVDISRMRRVCTFARQITLCHQSRGAPRGHCGSPDPMTMIGNRSCHIPREIVRHAFRLPRRVTSSFGGVADPPAGPEAEVFYEALGRRVARFGPQIAQHRRHHRPVARSVAHSK